MVFAAYQRGLQRLQSATSGHSGSGEQMNPYSLMLQKASIEIRQFQQSSPEARHFEKSWLENLAARLEHASGLSEATSVEREILAIGRSDIDSGPSSRAAMPSFYLALDAVQRARKHRHV